MSSAYFKLRLLRKKKLKNLNDNYHGTENDCTSEPEFNAVTSQNKCRVCLKDGNIPIFISNESSPLVESIRMFAAIEIYEDDAFPKYLCQSCYSLLQNAIVFRKTAQTNDAFLRESEYFNDDDLDAGEIVQTKSHENEFHENYSCDICNLKFNSLEEYKTHKKSKSHKNTRIQCAVCKRVLTTQFYKNHLAHHESASHLICDVCGKLYRKDNLIRHLQRHSYDLPFQCKSCPYRGRFSESLKIHMRTHTGDKPFSCDKCKLNFLTRSNLNRHLLIHNKEKPYKCVQCGRGFYTKRDVDVHVKADHVGVKDFLCKLCGNKYGTRKALMRHELRVHKRTKLAKGRMPLYLQAEYRIND